MHDYAPGSLWPVTNEDDRQIREVYARYGLAMYQAQVLEHGLVNTLMIFRLLPTMKEYTDRYAWESAFDTFYSVETGKTFGNILKVIQLINNFPSDLLKKLRSAKSERDYLAHRFFREHDVDFMNFDGRIKMIVECERLIDLFQMLDKEIGGFARPYRERYGITSEKIRELMDQRVQAGQKA